MFETAKLLNIPEDQKWVIRNRITVPPDEKSGRKWAIKWLKFEADLDINFTGKLQQRLGQG